MVTSRALGIDPAPSSAARETADDLALAELDSPVGRLGVAVSRRGLVALGWRPAAELAARTVVVTDPDRLVPVLEQLRAYFRGELRHFSVDLDWSRASRMQRMVLETLYRTVPYGSSVTYGELAHRSGTGVPARGVGAVLGANPLPIVVPCHRVVAAAGLGGYSGGRTGEGAATKRWLLTMEGVLQPPLEWPSG